MEGVWVKDFLHLRFSAQGLVIAYFAGLVIAYFAGLVIAYFAGLVIAYFDIAGSVLCFFRTLYTTLGMTPRERQGKTQDSQLQSGVA
jgi:small neutral amino acid transporter SnatA (MarC family)